MSTTIDFALTKEYAVNPSVTRTLVDKALEHLFSKEGSDPSSMTLSPKDHRSLGDSVRASTNIYGIGDLSLCIKELADFTRYINPVTGMLMKVLVSENQKIGMVIFD